MNPAAIHAAIIDAYQDGAFDLPTAFPGFAFTPPSQSRWARLAILHVDNDDRLYSVDRVTDIAQIDVMYPAGRGTAAIHAKVKALTDYFQPRARFTSGDVAVTVVGRDATHVRPDAGWLVATVSVTLRAAIDRP